MADRIIQPKVMNSDGQTYDNLIMQQAVNATNATNATTATTANTIVYTTVAPSASPAEGTLIVYYGSVLPSTRYDRVIYMISY